MTHKKTIAIILGTRPEIIKLAPVFDACKKERIPFFIIHTNQHYSKELDAVFFKELELPKPRYHLHIGSGLHGDQTGRMTAAIERVLIKEKPTAVLVHGDTNTTLAGALAASKLHIPLVHIEAGLRSGDRNMPEEINRILSDHASDLLQAPTYKAREHLLKEGVSPKNILVTGNTIVDSVARFGALAKKRDILKQFGLPRRGYFLSTIHRPEVTDDPKVLRGIFQALSGIARQYEVPVIMSLHPRTRKALNKARIAVDPSYITLFPPVGYLDFLALEVHARLILTDSGGLQEEAYLLRVPCVTISGTTERPETLSGGGNVLAGRSVAGIKKAVSRQLSRKPKWNSALGRVGSSRALVREVRKRFF